MHDRCVISPYAKTCKYSRHGSPRPATSVQHQWQCAASVAAAFMQPWSAALKLDHLTVATAQACCRGEQNSTHSITGHCSGWRVPTSVGGGDEQGAAKHVMSAKAASTCAGCAGVCRCCGLASAAVMAAMRLNCSGCSEARVSSATVQPQRSSWCNASW